MAKVTCQICKSKIEKSTSYRLPHKNGKPNHFLYYCNEKEYTEYNLTLEKYHETILFFATDILEYERGQIVPAEIKRRIKKLGTFYNYEVIKMTLEVNCRYLNGIVRHKNFDSEHHMIAYLMVVIENKINDVYKQWKADKRQQSKAKKTSESLDNSINSFLDSFDEPLQPKKSPEQKGIAAFLKEDDF